MVMRRSFIVRPPEQPPKFFLDRSLGRIAVPARLRAAGWDLVTLAGHYGTPADEQIADVQWIQDAATHGWPILMKDKRIRYRRTEIDAVVQHTAQCFVITRGDLRSAEMADRFQASSRAIYEAANTPGPYIHTVHSERLELIYPRSTRSCICARPRPVTFACIRESAT